MAGRMASLIDPATEKADSNAIKVIDSHTVQLNCLASDITIIAGMADYPAAVVHSSFDPATMASYIMNESEVGGKQLELNLEESLGTQDKIG